MISNLRRDIQALPSSAYYNLAACLVVLACLAGSMVYFIDAIRECSPVAVLLAAVGVSVLFSLVGVRRSVKLHAQRQQSHTELFKSDLRFRQLADAMPQIVWTAEPDGTVDYGNRTVAEQTGSTVDPGDPQSWIGTLHPDDVDGTVAAWTAAVAAGTELDIEYRMFRKADGSYRWHHVRATPIRDEGGNIIKWYGTATDHHDSKLASDRIAALAHQLSTTLESISEAFFTLDFEWRLTYLNRETERMAERSRDELLGKILWEEFPDLVGSIADTEYRRAIAEKRAVEFELPYRPLNRYFRVRAYPSPDGLTVYFADVSDRRRLQLFKDEQMGIVEQIAAGATPAVALAGAIRLIESQNDTLRCAIVLLDQHRSRVEGLNWPGVPDALAGAIRELAPAAWLRACAQPGLPAELCVSDIARDPLWATARPLLLEAGLSACWSYPLRSPGGHVFGAFAVFTPDVREPKPFEADMLASCAHTVSIALERQRSEQHLRLRNRAIEASANPILIRSAVLPHCQVEYANPALEQVLGYRAADLIGQTLSELRGGEQAHPGLEELQASWVRQCEAHVVMRLFHRDGTPVWLDTYSSPVKDEHELVTHFVQVMYNVTAARQYQAELEYQSNHDLLTGLANRNLLHDRASQEIARARGGRGEQVWLAFLNLDRFRMVNETLGHDAGDELLKATAVRIENVLGPVATAARWGSDEFVLVLPEGSDEQSATSIVSRVMDAVAQPLSIKGTDYFPTCTSGLAMFPADGDDADVLVRHAQMAMQTAKQGGGPRLQFFTAAMNERAGNRLRMESDLRQALERDELELHYQPQADLRTGRIVGMEALLRWRHPVLGMLAPDRFIPVAEDSGLIVPIGAWVLRTACSAARGWHESGFGDVCMSVNLSGVQFYQPDLIATVQAALDASGLDARYLDVELTEGLVMTDIEHALDIMHGLKALGVKLSLDDFGTGYSSLSYLKRFPIDVLKIDKSFVRNITTDPDEAAIARSIISLSHSLNLHVIAEGVETEEQLSFLRRHRCDQIQGYYFSRPVPAPELEQLLVADHALPAPELSSGHRQTLLIVDDEANIRSSLYRLLRRDGYHILRAASAEEGLAMLALHEVQVVVSDQLMPGMSGTEFLAKVKQLHPKTIRIMLSGYTAVDSIIEATNSGAVFRFHTKPWDDDGMRASIAEAFRYQWLLHGAAQGQAAERSAS